MPRNKTAQLRQQRLTKDAQDKAAAEGNPKPAKPRARAKNIIREGK